MAAIAARSGRLYVNITSGGTPEPIAFLNTWSLAQATDKIEVTSFGDVNKTYVSGLPDASGDFGGFYDTASPQLYTAAVDGVSRKFYLYPTVSTTTTYFFGTAIFDFNVTGEVSGAVAISGSWAAATGVSKVG